MDFLFFGLRFPLRDAWSAMLEDETIGRIGDGVKARHELAESTRCAKPRSAIFRGVDVLLSILSLALLYCVCRCCVCMVCLLDCC